MNQYNLIATEIEERIRLAWGSTFKVSRGRPKIKFTSAPYAVILLDGGIEEQGQGRNVIRTFQFKIMGVFPYESTSDSETVCMEKIDLLVQQLKPYDETDVPAVDPPFAGICDEHFVTSYSPLEEEPEDDFVMVEVGFTCRTHVYA
jgi:hypothetical protein